PAPHPIRRRDLHVDDPGRIGRPSPAPARLDGRGLVAPIPGAVLRGTCPVVVLDAPSSLRRGGRRLARPDRGGGLDQVRVAGRVPRDRAARLRRGGPGGPRRAGRPAGRIRTEERMSETTVEIEPVGKRFLTTTALEAVSFAVGPGITGLLGPNGAGKTTLLRVLATVLAPDGGRVRLLGQDPSRPRGRLAVRRSLGYM